MKEHRNAICPGQDTESAIAEHVNTQVNIHEIDWNMLCAVDSAQGKTERKVRKSMHIYIRKPAINQDRGIERNDLATQ